MYKWDKVFKSRPSKICGRQSLKNLKGNGLLKELMLLLKYFLLTSCISQITNFSSHQSVQK